MRTGGALAAALLLAVVAAPAATAAPTALTRIGHEEASALAGDEALWTRTRGRVLRLLALPVGGGGTPAERLRFTAPRGAVPSGRIAASPAIAGLVVLTADGGSTLRAWQAFGGPPRGPIAAFGPLRTLRPREYLTSFFEADAGRLFSTEIRGDLRAERYRVREPGRDPAAIAFPAVRAGPVFADDLAAFGVLLRGQPRDDEPRRLVVREWRTGRQRASVRIPGGIESLDIHRDGRVVVGEDGGGVLLVAPGGAGVRRIARRGVLPAFAGDAVVFTRQGPREDDERLLVAPPGGGVRAFGVPTTSIERVTTDERRVLWQANGCLLVAGVSERGAAAPAPGPCPRTELALDDQLTPTLRGDRRVPIVLRCVAAPAAGCRGRVKLQAEGRTREVDASPRVRFAIAAGRRKRVVVRLTRAGYARARRSASLGGTGLGVVAVSVDPAGRRSVLRDGLGVELPRR